MRVYVNCMIVHSNFAAWFAFRFLFSFPVGSAFALTIHHARKLKLKPEVWVDLHVPLKQEPDDSNSL